jgi:NAD(P)H dehydrogenase (quinone)
MSSAPTVYIILYSLYGHIYTLAKHIQSGLEEQGVQVKLYQVSLTNPFDVSHFVLISLFA